MSLCPKRRRKPFKIPMPRPLKPERYRKPKVMPFPRN